MWTDKVQLVLESRVTWGIITLLLAAIAYSGRVRVTISYILLVSAFAIGSFQILRLGMEIHLSLICCFVFGIALTLLSWWLHPGVTLEWFRGSRGISITPSEYAAQPLYQEFTAHVTNDNNYPIYNYSVVIMVSKGDLNVNTDLKFEPYEELGTKKSDFPFKAFGWGGTSDKYELSFMELWFPEIGAKSSQRYLVKIDGSKYKEESVVQFSIGNFSKKPNPVFKVPLDKNGQPIFPKLNR